eukprot:9470222-Pyramimonas_sp.AAC.2
MLGVRSSWDSRLIMPTRTQADQTTHDQTHHHKVSSQTVGKTKSSHVVFCFIPTLPLSLDATMDVGSTQAMVAVSMSETRPETFVEPRL